MSARSITFVSQPHWKTSKTVIVELARWGDDPTDPTRLFAARTGRGDVVVFVRGGTSGNTHKMHTLCTKVMDKTSGVSQITSRLYGKTSRLSFGSMRPRKTLRLRGGRRKHQQKKSGRDESEERVVTQTLRASRDEPPSSIRATRCQGALSLSLSVHMCVCVSLRLCVRAERWSELAALVSRSFRGAGPPKTCFV